MKLWKAQVVKHADLEKELNRLAKAKWDVLQVLDNGQDDGQQVLTVVAFRNVTEEKGKNKNKRPASWGSEYRQPSKALSGVRPVPRPPPQ